MQHSLTLSHIYASLQSASVNSSVVLRVTTTERLLVACELAVHSGPEFIPLL